MTSNLFSSETHEQLMARMKKAFELVQDKTHWKNPINAKVTPAQLSEAGVTPKDIIEAVTFYTATGCKVVDNTSMVNPHYVFKAPGYYAGPAN